MKKKFIFLAMMLLTFLGVNVLNAQEETITIGSGDKTNFRIPTNVYTKYSYCQQIYTQEELGIEAGVKITNISLKIATNYNTNRSWKVYMLNLEDKSSFDIAGWVSVTENDVFYDGSVSLYGEVNTWININSEKGFEYNGGNLLLCIQDYTGTNPVQFYFYTYSSGVDNSCIRYTLDYGDDPLTPDNISANGSRSDEKNQIIFTYESSAPAVMPSSVPEIISATPTHNSITLTWTEVENAKKYNVYTNTEELVATVRATSYTIENLDANTGYCYKVSAVNGEYETDPSEEYCRITLEAPKTRNIVFTLNDSYGDGWNGDAYLQIDATDGTSKQLKCSSGSSISYDVEITVGETVYVTYMKSGNNWPEENSYCIHYDDETEIYCSPTMDNTSARSYTFIVEPIPPKVTIAASAYDIYSDQTATLTATAANFDGDVTYSWFYNEEIVGTGATYTFDPSAEGIYTFTCTATDANNNEASESVTINVTERPVLALEVTAEKTEIYQGQYTMLDAKATGGFPPYTYKWFLNGEEYGTGESFYFYQTEVDEYTIKCEVTDDNNGTTEKDVTVSVLANPFFGKQFRVKVMEGTYAGNYLDVYNDNGTIGVESKTERNTQIFTIEKIAENQYYLKTADGYYIKCETGSTWWNVHAYNTYDKTPLEFEYTNEEQFYIKDYDKMTGNSQTGNDGAGYYFKVEKPEDSNSVRVYCDAPSDYQNKSTSYITTWSLEEVLPSPENLAIVEGEKTQLYPSETTKISWNALDGAAGYNVYVNDVKVNTGAVGGLSYELVNLPYGMNTIAVAAVFENGSESGMSNTVTVQMAGTFPLTIKVQDENGKAVAGAEIFIEGTDEYYNNVKFEGVVTNENGEWYKEDMPLLYESFGYNGNVSAEPFETGQISFYESGIEYNVPYTYTVEMELPIIYPQTEKQSYDANENIVLFWDAIDPEYVDGYNVYVNYEEAPRNAELLTTAIYTLEGGLAEEGYVHVTAVYKNYGESAKSYTYVNVNNYEYVNLSGIVTDDANNLIAGAEVVVEGRDNEWKEQRYTTLTNAEGAFELEVLPSYESNINDCYSVSVSKYGYSSYKSTEKYKAVVGSDIVLGAIVLTANADVEFAVEATKGEGNVTVEWTAPEGATQYNVFRKDVNTEEVVKLATSSETNYTDESWATLENGEYTYGVSALSETTSIVTENFDGYNVLPEGWYVPEGSNWYNSGNQMFSSYGYLGDIYYLVTPKINTRVENATISFRYFSGLWLTMMDELKVYYSTSQDGPWVNEIEDVELSSEWVTKEISLANIEEDEIYVAFANATVGANSVYLDEVTFPCVVSSESSINWASPLTKNDANVFTGAGGTDEWTLASNWSNGVPAAGANVFIEANVTIASDVNVNNMTINGGSVTINSGASLIVEGTLVNEAAENLVINDGTQIFQNNEEIPATFVMNINNWTENENAWQFIASPLLDASLFSHATGNYDLFKYIGYYDLEWYNHKLHAAGFGSTFEQGVGYLASHETANTIVMTGTLNNKNTHTWYSYIFTYDYEGVKDVANFNLLGNPFTFNMKWSEVVSTDLVTGYAYLNENGGYETAVDGEIAVGDAFFVKAKSADAQMSYGVRGAKAEQSEYINLIASGKAGRDNVIINLAGKQEGFTKMQNFNASIATVYVAEDNTRYGIYNCNSDIEEVVVSFNAKDMGDYTIAAVAEGGFSSVVLVDLFTGIETDLLTSGYTFAAKSGDNAERFVVRFSYSQDSAMDSNFVYQSGEDLIIMAEGALQIVDMLGRVVYYSEVATDVTRVNVSNFDNAAYIVRVVNGEGVKTQKVVIY